MRPPKLSLSGEEGLVRLSELVEERIRCVVRKPCVETSHAADSNGRSHA
jgi:hypothetical protein